MNDEEILKKITEYEGDIVYVTRTVLSIIRSKTDFFNAAEYTKEDFVGYPIFGKDGKLFEHKVIMNADLHPDEVGRYKNKTIRLLEGVQKWEKE